MGTDGSLSTINSQQKSDDDGYAFLNEITNKKFEALKNIYSYDTSRDPEPRRYSPSLFIQSPSEDIYCPRAVQSKLLQTQYTPNILSQSLVPPAILKTQLHSVKTAKRSSIDRTSSKESSSPQKSPSQ